MGLFKKKKDGKATEKREFKFDSIDMAHHRLLFIPYFFEDTPTHTLQFVGF